VIKGGKDMKDAKKRSEKKEVAPRVKPPSATVALQQAAQKKKEQARKQQVDAVVITRKSTIATVDHAEFLGVKVYETVEDLIQNPPDGMKPYLVKSVPGIKKILDDSEGFQEHMKRFSADYKATAQYHATKRCQAPTKPTELKDILSDEFFKLAPFENMRAAVKGVDMSKMSWMRPYFDVSTTGFGEDMVAFTSTEQNLVGQMRFVITGCRKVIVFPMKKLIDVMREQGVTDPVAIFKKVRRLDVAGLNALTEKGVEAYMFEQPATSVSFVPPGVLVVDTALNNAEVLGLRLVAMRRNLRWLAGVKA
jgi:hypothetical protein